MVGEDRKFVRDVLPWLALAAAAEIYLKKDIILPAIKSKVKSLPEKQIIKEKIEEKSDSYRSIMRNLAQIIVSSYLKDTAGGDISEAIPLLKERVQELIKHNILALTSNPVAIDAYEEEDTLVYEVTVPGVKKEDIEIQASEKMLIINVNFKKEKEIPEEKLIMKEHPTGEYRRNITFPVSVIPDKATAELKDGVLRLVFPKSPEVVAKPIEIQ